METAGLPVKPVKVLALCRQCCIIKLATKAAALLVGKTANGESHTFLLVTFAIFKTSFLWKYWLIYLNKLPITGDNTKEHYVPVYWDI